MSQLTGAPKRGLLRPPMTGAPTGQGRAAGGPAGPGMMPPAPPSLAPPPSMGAPGGPLAPGNIGSMVQPRDQMQQPQPGQGQGQGGPNLSQSLPPWGGFGARPNPPDGPGMGEDMLGGDDLGLDDAGGMDSADAGAGADAAGGGGVTSPMIMIKLLRALGRI